MKVTTQFTQRSYNEWVLTVSCGENIKEYVFDFCPEIEEQDCAEKLIVSHLLHLNYSKIKRLQKDIDSYQKNIKALETRIEELK